MQKDYDIIRAVLIYSAGLPKGKQRFTLNSIRPRIFPEFDEYKLLDHVWYLIDSGYLEGEKTNEYDATILAPTKKGERFAELALDENIWQQTMAKARRVASVPLDVLEESLKKRLIVFLSSDD